MNERKKGPLLYFATAILVWCWLPLSAGAAPLKKVTIIQTTSAVTPTEVIILSAIPRQLGYYRDEGVDVTVLQGNGPANAAQALQSGSAEFATTMPESILQMREQGGDLVAFYTLTQDNGNALAVKADSPINTLEDVRGKTIGAFTWAAGGGALLIRTLANIGIKDNEYNKVFTPPGPATALLLKNGQVDGLVLWYSAYAPMEVSGLGLKFIDFKSAHEVAGYALATTDKYLKQDPKTVEGLCRAVNKAFLFARQNPDAAIDLFLKEYPSYKPASLDQAVASKQYKRVLMSWLKTAVKDIPLEGPAGIFSPEKWVFTQEFYTAVGQLKGTKSAADGYTNQFMAECNKFDHKAVIDAASAYHVDAGK
jgi:NitT/TauT family transport system substrate-binding protein